MTKTMQYDLYSPTFKANPYPTYATLREEAPVCYNLGMDGENKLWFITRYADCETVLRDHKRFVKNYEATLTPEAQSQLAPPSKLDRLLNQHLLNLDGADHARLRGLINKAFTAQMVNRMQDRVQALADELLDQVQAQGAMDLIDDYAFPCQLSSSRKCWACLPQTASAFASGQMLLYPLCTRIKNGSKRLRS